MMELFAMIASIKSSDFIRLFIFREFVELAPSHGVYVTAFGILVDKFFTSRPRFM